MTEGAIRDNLSLKRLTRMAGSEERNQESIDTLTFLHCLQRIRFRIGIRLKGNQLTKFITVYRIVI